MKIGSTIIENPIILAPLAGYTDEAFRRVCSDYVEYSTTEMVSVKALFYGDKKTKTLLKKSPFEKKLALQLFGSEPEIFADVIENTINKLDDFTAIDINMGCPAPKIVKTGAGSALIEKPSLAYEIMKSCIDASKIPVTIKIRKSFKEKDSREVIELANKAGISLITLHGRSREEYYTGKSDWEYINSIAKNSDVPIVGNGDIDSYEAAKNLMDSTNIVGIAIGRGAIGNPFIFKEINFKLKGLEYTPPTDGERIKTALRHLKYSVENKGERLGILEMRKHFVGYFKGMVGSKEIRGKINQINTYSEVVEAIEEYLNSLT